MPKPSLLAIVATLSLTANSVWAEKGYWAGPNDPAALQMKHAEQIWNDAGCSPQPELKSFFAPEFLGTTKGGKRYGRDEASPPGTDRDCQLGEIRIQRFGDDHAVSYGSETSLRKDDFGIERKRCLIWTDIWLKRDDRWQIIAAHDSEMPCK